MGSMEDRARRFGAWLRWVMTDRDMSQADLAREVGASTGSVSMWTSGERLPRPEGVLKIGDALGYRAEYVLGKAGYVPESDPESDAELDDLLASLRALATDADDRFHVRAVRDTLRRKKRQARIAQPVGAKMP